MSTHHLPVLIAGGGLAGSEAALQLARRGYSVILQEMRPAVMTPAHRTGELAELVCSNSLKSENPVSAPFLLKEELRRLGSILLDLAGKHQVPAGQALAVDRREFAAAVTRTVESSPLIRLVREELTGLPAHRPLLLATGPLTSPGLAQSIQEVTGNARLYFYDAISPVVEASSIDWTRVFSASRYGRGGDDYVNCPFSREEYRRFWQELTQAAEYPLHEFEKGMYFEGCLPIEELARRGEDTLRFGPMKPVGLVHPDHGEIPYAVVQLRAENLLRDAFNLVGFQNHLRQAEQARVFRLIPGLEQAEFIRFGQMHRNTYLNAPALLTPGQELKQLPGVFVAGQLCGLEGYIEAIATGLLASWQIIRQLEGRPALRFPRATALGSLQQALSEASPENYQPVNITFALLPGIPETLQRRLRGKKPRHQWLVQNALRELESFLAGEHISGDAADCPTGT